MSTSSNASSNDKQQSAPISLALVRKLFARPARVAESQFLRREIAGRMFERLTLIKTNPQSLLDAGCGEGDDLLALHQSFPDAALLGIDASAAMLATARQRAAQSLSAMQRVLKSLLGRAHAAPGAALLASADFANLPLLPASVDLVWSNMALHWHPQPDRVFAEWRRVLRVDGLLMFSCFGPDTFLPLRAAFAEIGEPDAVLPFVDLHDFGDMLVDVGFATPVMDMEKLQITYTSAEKLLADVQAFGGNPLSTRRGMLSGRHRHQRLLQALESQRGQDGKISLTIEVIYGHAFKPLPKKTADGESIIRFDLKRS
jgi:malonyl-CoA O-methyltransferase